ncbi:PhzF family phenazine biosynthesis protein [Pendulispora brunnea]|uniref:PhzF family phenazine biosynthesis protein n=1 Tax=Pendulispora brunnea TaxID=2905690 RepID=A0ABZ2K657_9BACT
MTSTSLHVLHVFAVPGTTGPSGNPTTIALHADALSSEDMRGIAARFGHESGFVSAPPAGSAFDFTFRFFVPNHEMEMCGHATLGALWIVRELGLWPASRASVAISTKSGPVTGQLIEGELGGRIAISQPKGRVVTLPDPDAHTARVASVLGITPGDLAGPIRNAATSRVKTLVPLKSEDAVHALRPDFARMEALCEDIGSTGLYPYAAVDLQKRIFEARQFPKAVGYPEDAATGIAASALAFGLLENGLVTANEQPICVRQGRAMGQPSQIEVTFDGTNGCWLTGHVRREVKE